MSGLTALRGPAKECLAERAVTEALAERETDVLPRSSPGDARKSTRGQDEGGERKDEEEQHATEGRGGGRIGRRKQDEEEDGEIENEWGFSASSSEENIRPPSAYTGMAKRTGG